ncbi:MAG: ornithine cyclodeaminase family protein, partial [Deltaproteobacteria bacterium]
MLFISENDVRKAVSIAEVIERVENAFLHYSRGLIQVPSRVTLRVRDENNDAIFLVANYRSMPFYGIKEASSFPTNMLKGKPTVMSNIQLYSADTGEPLALVSAVYLTALKTGAASAVATKHLAIQGNVSIAIIGTGVQARTQLEAVQHVKKLKELRVYDIDKSRAKKFAEYAENNKNSNYPIIISTSANECIENVDVIITATTSTIPVFDDEYVKRGAHINAIGSFTPDMQEIAEQTVVRADKIVTDNQEETWKVAGDLLVPLKAGKIDRTRLYGELGDIVAGKLPGREREEEITIYESVGFGALDIAVAVLAYEKSSLLGIGTEVNL